MRKRVWYDEKRYDPHEQIALKLCFTDILVQKDSKDISHSSAEEI
jgi:hypothetical protein